MIYHYNARLLKVILDMIYHYMHDFWKVILDILYNSNAQMLGSYSGYDISL